MNRSRANSAGAAAASGLTAEVVRTTPRLVTIGSARSRFRHTPRQPSERSQRPRRSPLRPREYGFALSGQSLLKALTVHLPATLTQRNPAIKIRPPHRRVLTKPSEASGNEGRDNINNEYILRVGEVLQSPDGKHYVVIDLLGHGTFGQAVKCRCEQTGQTVAIKVVKNHRDYTTQSQKEIEILQRLQEKLKTPALYRIVNLLSHFSFRNHNCLVFELLSINLFQLMKRNGMRGLPLKTTRTFCHQVLISLCALEDAGVIHCDLKPENILLETLPRPESKAPQSNAIRVIDFGSACYQGQQLHTYIQSRFYRAPEVLLGMNGTCAMDMWSFGCIAAELLLGCPLFPGSSEYDQIVHITGLLGPLPTDMLQVGVKTNLFYAAAPDGFHMRSFEGYQAEVLRTNKGKVVPKQSPTISERAGVPFRSLADVAQYALKGDAAGEMQAMCLAHFLGGILNPNPAKRWTAHQALGHPFISEQPFTRAFTPSPVDTPQFGRQSSSPMPCYSPVPMFPEPTSPMLGTVPSMVYASMPPAYMPVVPASMMTRTPSSPSGTPVLLGTASPVGAGMLPAPMYASPPVGLPLEGEVRRRPRGKTGDTQPQRRSWLGRQSDERLRLSSEGNPGSSMEDVFNLEDAVSDMRGCSLHSPHGGSHTSSPLPPRRPLSSSPAVPLVHPPLVMQSSGLLMQQAGMQPMLPPAPMLMGPPMVPSGPPQMLLPQSSLMPNGVVIMPPTYYGPPGAWVGAPPH